jgi:pSer/pThr/pTyr-binding forkhead associated (FHA) protein
MSTVLQELGPDGPVAYYVLEPKGPIIVGRGRGCSIRLDDSRVSRQHCELRFEDGAWSVYDNGSTNGTWVNNQQIDRWRLEDGNIITIGRVRLYFRLDVPPPDDSLSTDHQAVPPASPVDPNARTAKLPPDEQPFGSA